MTDAERVIVVGGGITGLAAAYALTHGADAAGASDRPDRGAPAVTVLEASGRLGGKILTERVDGFLIEGGADSFLTTKPHALELARRLGLHLVPTRPPRRVFVLHRGRLHPLPEGAASLAPQRLGPFLATTLFTPWEKVRIAMELLLPPDRSGAEETIGGFVRRRLGAAAVERLAAPLLAGIHAGDPETLSLRATFPRLAEAEQRHGSLIRAALARRRARAGQAAAGEAAAEPSPSEASLFMTPAGGLAELVDRLAQACGAEVRTQAAVRALAREPDGYAVHLDGGEVLRARAVVLAVPAPAAAALLQDVDPPAAAIVSSIPHVSTAAVALGFRRADVGHDLAGHGYVVSPAEGALHTAVTWVSSKWPDRAPPGCVLLRVFVGRAADQRGPALDDDALVRAVLREIAPVLGVAGAPAVARVYRWEAAMPQYTVGHLDRVRALRRALARTPGVILAGAAYEGVGIPDCVRQGMEAAARARAQLRRAAEAPAR